MSEYHTYRCPCGFLTWFKYKGPGFPGIGPMRHGCDRSLLVKTVTRA